MAPPEPSVREPSRHSYQHHRRPFCKTRPAITAGTVAWNLYGDDDGRPPIPSVSATFNTLTNNPGSDVQITQRPERRENRGLVGAV